MVLKPKYGHDIAPSLLNSLDNYVLVTQKDPWDTFKAKITVEPAAVILNSNMDYQYLQSMSIEKKLPYSAIVGLGGGVACDTAKFLAYQWNLPLYLIPSIISVDAFLCEAIGVRDNNKVKYIGNVSPEQLLIDFSLVRTAPNYLNYAGVGDVVSCCSALGDWKISHQEFGDPFDSQIFKDTKDLVRNIFGFAQVIHELTDEGIKYIVESLRKEVFLSEKWGNARPEEGSEHFLAYALEKLYPRSYLHGALVCLNTLIILRMQGENAVISWQKLKEFLDTIGVQYHPSDLGISKDEFRKALLFTKSYVEAEDLFHGVWYWDNPFQNISINAILDWIFSFKL